MIRADDYRVAVAQVRSRLADAAMPLYTVRAGDSISDVAVRECDGKANRWTGIYAASRARHLTAANADQLRIGQLLAISCTYLPSQLRFSGRHSTPATAAAVVSTNRDQFDGHHGACGDGDGDGMDAPCSVIFPSSVPASSPYRASHRVYHAYRAASSVTAGSSFEACVIARESGGNSQVMNSSGHYGLYQFSASTWQAYGGSAADFGHASAAEQQAVFRTAIAQGGQSNWSPYDGC